MNKYAEFVTSKPHWHTLDLVLETMMSSQHKKLSSYCKRQIDAGKLQKVKQENATNHPLPLLAFKISAKARQEVQQTRLKEKVQQLRFYAEVLLLWYH